MSARGRDDLAAFLYTSGTTGRSKGAMLTHGNLASNAEALRDDWRFTAEDRLLHALPIFHTHGLFVATNVTLMAGGSLIFLPTFNANEIIRLLPQATRHDGRADLLHPPSGRDDFTRDLVAHMRLFVVRVGAAFRRDAQGVRERTGHAILERYGMTETNMNISNPYDGERIPGSHRAAAPRRRDPHCRPADRPGGAAGEVGVIEIRGPNVFKGYWRMPEKTKEEFREDGFFVSGDLGHRP